MGATHVVEVAKLVREYAPAGTGRGAALGRVRALDGLSLQVERGLLFGLLGPNGAGKTTLVKVLSTVITPTSGSARVFGHDVRTQPHLIRPRIGVAYGGDLGLYWRLNGLENLVFAGQLQGMGAREARRRAEELLERFGLTAAARQRVDGYSKGMRQRLHLARSLMHDPELLFLDEPTSGLDPAATRSVQELIADLKGQGKTIFLTTHNLTEADRLCDQVAIIARGRLVATGPPDAIKRSLDRFRLLEVTVDGPQLPDRGRLTGLDLGDGATVVGCEPREGGLLVRVRYRGDAPVQPLLTALGPVRVREIATRGSTLEEAYLRLVQTAPGPDRSGGTQ